MLATWMEPAPRTAGALDGKTLRGSFDHLHDQPAAHVLSAFASDAALILAHQEVAAADSDDVARSFRDHVARCSDMMSPA